MVQMQVPAPFRSPECQSQSLSHLSESSQSPVDCLNHTPRPHEFAEPTQFKRRSETHLGTEIKAAKKLVQTVQALPESPKTSGQSFAKHRLSPRSDRHRRRRSRNIERTMHLPPPMKTIALQEELCLSSDASTQRRGNVRKQRPQSALIPSPTPAFEESPGFAAQYNINQDVVGKPVTKRRRSSLGERPPRNSQKPQPRHPQTRGGNTNDLILFFQKERFNFDDDPVVTPVASLNEPKPAKPITSFKAASNKFSQFIHPKPATVISVTDPNPAEVANGAKKAKVVTKPHNKNRTKGLRKKSPMDFTEKSARPDIVDKEGSFDGLVDLNAAENELQRKSSQSISDEDDKKDQEAKAEKWERWNQYAGRFGSADGFTEQVHAAMCGQDFHIPVSKRDLLSTSISSNLGTQVQDNGNNARNDPSFKSYFDYSNGPVLLTASNAPRRKGAHTSNDVHVLPAGGQSPTTSAGRLDTRNETSGKSFYNIPNTSIGSHISNTPATHVAPPGPRTSTLTSSRNVNDATAQIGLFPINIGQVTHTTKSPRNPLSIEELVPHRSTARTSHLAVPDGPSVSTSTLSVIESQAIPQSPPVSPASGSFMSLESGQKPQRAHHTSKNKAPTEPPMGPLPELPEGHDRSDAVSRSSYRSKRSSRQVQAHHGHSIGSLASVTSGLSGSPTLFQVSQESPRTSRIARGSGEQRNVSPFPMETISRDFRSPQSSRSVESMTSTTSQTTRAEKVRARKLRDTASIRARIENRALEMRDALLTPPAAEPEAAERSPKLSQFPPIPLSLPASQSLPSQTYSRPGSFSLRNRTSFLRNNSLTSRQQLLRSPIFIVAESDPATSKFRTACRSPTPSSPAFSTGGAVVSIQDHSTTEQPPTVRRRKSERSLHSIVRNGAQTPPRSESSIQSSDEEGVSRSTTTAHYAKRLSGSKSPVSSAAKMLAAEQKAREDMLEQRIRRLEVENKKYLAIIVAWLDPERVLIDREASLRSNAASAARKSSTASIAAISAGASMENAGQDDLVPAALNTSPRELSYTSCPGQESVEGLRLGKEELKGRALTDSGVSVEDGHHMERALAHHLDFFRSRNGRSIDETNVQEMNAMASEPTP